MDHDQKGHTKEYNTLKERLQEMRMKASGDTPWRVLIGRAETQADALENLYIKDMRQASTEIAQSTTDFKQHYEKLTQQFLKIQGELEALHQQPHGFGTYLRHVGYEEVEDRRGNKHKTLCKITPHMP